MSDKTIPPCPVCVATPTEAQTIFGIFLDVSCKCLVHILGRDGRFSKHTWAKACNRHIGRACRELGIETVEQLNARLAPDPRVVVLTRAMQCALDYLNGSTDMECIAARSALQRALIAAQRGEG